MSADENSLGAWDTIIQRSREKADQGEGHTEIHVNRSQDFMHHVVVYVDGEAKASIMVCSRSHTYPAAPGGPRTERIVELSLEFGDPADGWEPDESYLL